MATCESDGVNSSSDDTDAREKLQLKSIDELCNLGQSELVEYIKKLHKKLTKTCKKLKKCRQKLKAALQNAGELTLVDTQKILPVKDLTGSADTIEGESDEKKPVSKQKTQADGNEQIKGDNENSLSATDAFSFVHEMRQKAEQAQNINNFVYEPTSGLYYDPKTGYYYNAEYGLYYDGNTGCYYSYDETKQSFEFHSHAQVQNEQNTTATTHPDNAANHHHGEDDDDIIDEVEFDEYGGVITDKNMLKQIKGQKEKAKRKQLESRRKSKKGQKKRNKKEKYSKSRKSKKRYKSEEKKEHKRRRKDVEDGELSTSSSQSKSSDSSSDSRSEDDSDSDSENTDVPLFKSGGHFQDIAKKYPPSLRIIVQETNAENLRVGSLHIITFKGGSLGREGSHDVIIPDVNVSKCHLKFNYDTKMGIYKCIDLGSRNGTILNGARISTTKSESQPQDLVHGSVIQIAQTKLLCHVHEGNSTCGLCEPGLLIETQTRECSTSVAQPVPLTHKEQLKMIQKKYGLENEKFVEAKANVGGSNYIDRAATRRINVGSSTDKEKTQVASVNTEISSENKGFKMLSKLGWSKGNALGKTQASSGLLAPINVVSNEGKTGLGCEQQPITSVTYTAAAKQRLANLKITQERYKRADIFVESSDDSN